MVQTMVQEVELKSPGVICDLVQTSFWCEESEKECIVWGIRVSFLNGEIMEIQNVFTNLVDADQFKLRIHGSDICPYTLSELMDDYLAEIYGVWC